MPSDKTPRTKRRYFKETRFRQIRAFVELARRHSFTGAAHALGLSAPSIWQQIRALEDQFGAPLVEAHGHRVELTEDGRNFLELAAPLVESFDSLSAAFADRRKRTPRSLTVAAPASLLLGRELGEPILRYRQEFPEVHLTLLDRPSGLAVEFLQQERADLAVIAAPAEAAALPQFQTFLLTRFVYRLICREDHPLATERRISLRSLAREQLVLAAEESSSRKRVEQVFAEAGLRSKLQVNMTAGSLAVILTYVRLGFGISIAAMSEQATPAAASPGEQAIVYRDLSRLFGAEQIVLIERKGRHELPHVRAFREMVCEAMGKMN